MAGGRVEDGRRIVSWMRARLAMVTVAAVGIYIPTLGIPFPGSCMQPGPIASAGPSPTCGGDLRECLRQSADMRQTTFGGRYVTAEDVARCMEAFNACIHGGAGGDGSDGSPPSTSAGGGRTGLPSRFRMSVGSAISDCRIAGNTVTCTSRLEPRPAGVNAWMATIAGTISGLSVTGMKTEHVESDGADCATTSEGSGPFTYDFTTNGTVSVHEGPIRWQTTHCTGSNSSTEPVRNLTGTWSVTT